MSRRLTITIADDVYDHIVSGQCKPAEVCGFAEHICMAVYESANDQRRRPCNCTECSCIQPVPPTADKGLCALCGYGEHLPDYRPIGAQQ